MKKPVLVMLKEIGIIKEFTLKGSIVEVEMVSGLKGNGEWGSNQYSYVVILKEGGEVRICCKTLKVVELTAERVIELNKIKQILNKKIA